jgi:hypothetical protein
VNVRARSLHTAVIGVTIAIIAIFAPAARGGAAAATTCSTTSGVTVIVDFAHFHGAIDRGCAPGASTTALAAMQAAGFSTAGTTRYGDAFLCRIDNLPSAQAEACTDTPPAKSSWSFYSAHATDTSWTYSRVGVLSYRPRPGTIIAFAFGNLAKPRVLPAAAIRARTTPSTTTTAPPTSAPPTVPTVAPPAPIPRVAAAVATTTTLSRPTTSVAASSTTVARSSTTTSTTLAPSSARAGARIVDRPSITHRTVHPHNDGSPAGALLAAVLVVAIAAASVLAVRTRRRRAA